MALRWPVTPHLGDGKSPGRSQIGISNKVSGPAGEYKLALPKPGQAASAVPFRVASLRQPWVGISAAGKKLASGFRITDAADAGKDAILVRAKAHGESPCHYNRSKLLG
ncbi:hypothetical protein [uncultured Bosea sp.]|uniref:hypothetical protein n=1 Tax=uncultured Bosea sp. TaxID=211457 RepID=UPI0025F34C11|nr:hypothetical protein [uncultured Bosea sp.]